jgi:hypothetical protein
MSERCSDAPLDVAVRLEVVAQQHVHLVVLEAHVVLHNRENMTLQEPRWPWRRNVPIQAKG